ncbi:DoxX family protein [Chitinophaga pinensis]|uniref:DoxX family protein n=1 Tax=Chitinophaga pinensis (strain ATCC 43595 / DSM 2588 / LMG 13176 / NBRC 15968 / NCIMB 11800 / UQM 2034) TaxID=485918 RepID=A0A979GQX9_CHIPD|nr:DoxX family protein [Chitinophaga pinensis]ACU60498.1 DoxX family protein [Chitinophaga pinensis DSM 2588]
MQLKLKRNRYSDWSVAGLRTIAGIGFIVHGWAKISRGTAGFEKLLLQIHTPYAHFMSILVPYLELIGGMLLILGFLTRIISTALIVVMLTAMFTIHIRYGFSTIQTTGLNTDGPIFGPPGYEINLLYIGILAFLLINGAGRVSADSGIKRGSA